MHELSIAMNIVEIAEEELLRHGGERVRVVYLQMGPLAGVAKEALLFSFRIACQGTAAEGSSLVIEDGEKRDLNVLRLEIDP
jgi:hydrogenase nickel incorporation protein HypA/HybF